ncbi:hypothetical protein BaRGS_00008008 [Batillaria attramentaria]|uniref:Uncharacterized protein n=1 Tax=Batillaria attramentaria TaxID=370345 RepID=A0ABD0LME2_9CAEN
MSVIVSPVSQECKDPYVESSYLSNVWKSIRQKQLPVQCVEVHTSKAVISPMCESPYVKSKVSVFSRPALVHLVPKANLQKSQHYRTSRGAYKYQEKVLP